MRCESLIRRLFIHALNLPPSNQNSQLWQSCLPLRWVYGFVHPISGQVWIHYPQGVGWHWQGGILHYWPDYWPFHALLRWTADQCYQRCQSVRWMLTDDKGTQPFLGPPFEHLSDDMVNCHFALIFSCYCIFSGQFYLVLDAVGVSKFARYDWASKFLNQYFISCVNVRTKGGSRLYLVTLEVLIF